MTDNDLWATIERLEQEADWLAAQLGYDNEFCVRDMLEESKPCISFEECKACWRKAARQAVANQRASK